MTPLPVTLLTAAALTGVNGWLSNRIGALRRMHKISVGDAGNEALLRRMRAQANFIEFAPMFLIMLAALELSQANRTLLAIVAAAFAAARIAHAVGMEGGPLQRWRMVGMMTSVLATVLLALWAVLCVAGLGC